MLLSGFHDTLPVDGRLVVLAKSEVCDGVDLTKQTDMIP